MTWALITMLCTRFCQPQYVELYTTRDQCQQQMKPQSNWGQQTQYCVPVAKKD